MKPGQQRIVIAETCGWKRISELDVNKEYANEDKKLWRWVGQLPHYLSDLNAMHEAEKLLTPLQRAKYLQSLESICTYDISFATATHRAEAFLKALNLWKSE